MRAVVLMFDTLCRRYLGPYGGTDIPTPGFDRLAEHSVRFDNCYAGSMPCMPARREMHTGRHNFLHRSWGPLEPFDDSVPSILSAAGIHTHLSTDHYHYWEDGGATYHNRFDTYELFRGQEGDRWKGVVDPPAPPANLNPTTTVARQDWINRTYMPTEDTHSQTATVDSGLEFIAVNAHADSWMLQIECFDPHEPFFTYPEYLAIAGVDTSEPIFDWPQYRRVTESMNEQERLRRSYLALLAQCDRSVQRVLAAFDEHDLWSDTALIVCTDHGFLLGEHGWWGKTVQPFYDETIHTPLFVWDPRSGERGSSREALVQTVDLGPTLLDVFDCPPTDRMQGHSLSAVITEDAPIRKGALFGVAGGHVNVTDGRYVYMRSCVRPENSPLHEYTLMPTHMRGHFSAEELRAAELVEGFPFTRGIPVLRTPAWTVGNPFRFGTLLYDLELDPQQQRPLRDDDELEMTMIELMVELMRESEAPAEQYERLGLPPTGPVTAEHVLISAQWNAVVRSTASVPMKDDFAPDAPVAHAQLSELLAHAPTAAVVESHFPFISGLAPMMRERLIGAGIVELNGFTGSQDMDGLLAIDRELRSALTT